MNKEKVPLFFVLLVIALTKGQNIVLTSNNPVIEGNDFIFLCNDTDNTGLNITYFVNGLNTGPLYDKIISNPPSRDIRMFTVANVERSDSMTLFTCAIGSSSKSITLVVYFKALFTNTFLSETLFCQSSLNISFDLMQGFPPSNFTIYKDGDLFINANNRVQANATGIKVSSLEVNDTGEYVFSLVNEAGMTNLTFFLTVYCGPFFSFGNNKSVNTTVIEGELFTINCTVTLSVPPATIYLVIKNNTPMNITRNPVYTFNNINSSFTGRYQCKADSGQAITTYTYNLVVSKGVVFNFYGQYPILGSAFTINEGYPLAIGCHGINGNAILPVWLNSQGNRIRNLLDLIQRLYTRVGPNEKFASETDMKNFTGLFLLPENIGGHPLVYLLTFGNLRGDFFPITKDIEGNYTCIIGNRSRSLKIVVNVPNGLYSQFFIRMSINLNEIINIMNVNFQVAFFQSIIHKLFVNGSNSSTYPIQTASCSSVPLTHSVHLNRLECVMKEYPPVSRSEQLKDVALIENKTAHLIEIFNMSVTGFCDRNVINNTVYGNYVWEETIGGNMVSLQCVNNPNGHATRSCLINGNGWDAIDFSDCNRVTCDNETLYTDRGTFEWPVTLAGIQITLVCPNGPKGAVATRRCTVINWESSNMVSCATTVIANKYKALSKVNITFDNFESIFNNLTLLMTMTNITADQNTKNIQILSSIFQQTATLPWNSLNMGVDIYAEHSTDEVIKDTIQILDNVEEWPSVVVRAHSNEIIQYVETINEVILQYLDIDNFEEDVINLLTVITDDIAMQGQRVERQKFVGATFIAFFSNGTLDVHDQTDSTTADFELATITLPQNIVNVTTDTNDINIAFTVYTKSKLFPIRHTNDTIIRGTQIGSAIIGASIAGLPDHITFTEPVNIVLWLDTNIENFSSPQCVFWDFSAGGQGNWSTEGCSTVANSSDLSFVTCSCYHLTNFAVLVDIYDRVVNITQPPKAFVVTLGVVTYIGVSLSILGLTLTLITLLIFKIIRQRDVTKIHFQLCSSLLCLLLIFISGIDKVSLRELCITVGVLIHYFTLVVWMWMGAEALTMFYKLVIVFTDITWCYFLKLSVLCWGLPLLPVVITVAIDQDAYIILYSDGQTGFCFLRDMGPFLGAFLIPIFIIMIFNMIIYILVIRVVILHAVKKNKRTKQSSKSPQSKTEAVKTLISFWCIMFLFGFSWIFAVFTFISEPKISFAIQFVFAFLNSFQGFFIFLFFVILNGDSRKAWMSVLCRPLLRMQNKSHTTSSRADLRFSSDTGKSLTDALNIKD